MQHPNQLLYYMQMEMASSTVPDNMRYGANDNLLQAVYKAASQWYPAQGHISAQSVKIPTVRDPKDAAWRIEQMQKIYQILSKTPYLRKESMQDLWSEGSSRLLYKSACEEEENAPLLVFCPSLINRHYIFDLQEDNSVMNFFASHHYTSLVIDWGDPAQEEQCYGVSDYIQRLERILLWCKENYPERPLVLLGYCMGGLMSLAVSQLSAALVDRLVLLATPWDFYASDVKRVALQAQSEAWFRQSFERQVPMPGVQVHHMLYGMDPVAVHDKYVNLAHELAQCRSTDNFVAREYWLHDYVDVAALVAKELFVDFALDNVAMQQKWAVDQSVICPKEIVQPTLLVIAKKDKVVPPLCSLPLSVMIDNVELLYSPSGHVGMVAGEHAQKNLWNNIESWINTG